MKKIISAILLVIIMVCMFTGCVSKKDITAIEYDSTIVDVSIILENREIFEKRVPSTNNQKRFKDSMISLIREIESNEIKDFEIKFSNEVFSSWEECNDYAEALEPSKTHLGNCGYYYLWLAYRIINEEATWEEICDNKKTMTTIAFAEKNCWVGTCTTGCMLYSLESTETYIHGPNFHAVNSHKQWQAFVIKIID